MTIKDDGLEDLLYLRTIWWLLGDPLSAWKTYKVQRGKDQSGKHREMIYEFKM